MRWAAALLFVALSGCASRAPVVSPSEDEIAAGYEKASATLVAASGPAPDGARRAKVADSLVAALQLATTLRADLQARLRGSDARKRETCYRIGDKVFTQEQMLAALADLAERARAAYRALAPQLGRELLARANDELKNEGNAPEDVARLSKAVGDAATARSAFADELAKLKAQGGTNDPALTASLDDVIGRRLKQSHDVLEARLEATYLKQFPNTAASRREETRKHGPPTVVRVRKSAKERLCWRWFQPVPGGGIRSKTCWDGSGAVSLRQSERVKDGTPIAADDDLATVTNEACAKDGETSLRMSECCSKRASLPATGSSVVVVCCSQGPGCRNDLPE